MPTTAPIEPTAAPVPTHALIRRECHESRERAGLVYEYDPGEVTRAEATNRHCGGVVRVCPNSYTLSDQEYIHHPEETSRQVAEAAQCGSLAPVTETCDEIFEHGGDEFTYDPDDFDLEDAMHEYCGRENPLWYSTFLSLFTDHLLEASDNGWDSFDITIIQEDCMDANRGKPVPDFSEMAEYADNYVIGMDGERWDLWYEGYCWHRAVCLTKYLPPASARDARKVEQASDLCLAEFVNVTIFYSRDD